MSAAAIAFLSYSFVNGITPGPANLCSLSTAFRSGKTVALKQWRGLFTGYLFISLVSAGLTGLIGTAFGEYIRYFSFAGALYILWLAIHILRDNGDGEDHRSESGQGRFREGTFWFGFFLQTTNAKVILFCLTVFTGYVLPYRKDAPALILVALLLPCIGPVCNLAWLFAGAKLESHYAAHRRLINAVMAAALVLCAFGMVL